MNNLIYCGIIVFLTGFSGVYAQPSEDTMYLEPFVVTDSLIRTRPFVTNHFEQKKILSIPNRDMGDFLRNIPNVSGIRKGGASIDPVVRGFKYSQIIVTPDNGIKIENGCPNRMDPASSRVEIEDIEKIEVLKGPFALRFGPSLGGVINMVTERPHPYSKPEIHATALYGFETNWNGQREHITINGGNKNLYFLASAGYKDFGNYSSGSSGEEDTTFQSSFSKYHFNVKAGWTDGRKHSLLASYFSTHGRDVMFPALTMDEISDDTQIAAINYHLANDTGRLKAFDARIYHSTVDHLMDNRFRPGYEAKQMVAAVTAVNTGARAEMTWQVNKTKIITGADFEHITKDGERTMTMLMMGTTSVKKTNLWREALIRNTGIFCETALPSGKYEIVLSARGDYNAAQSSDTLVLVKDGAEYFNRTGSGFLNWSASAGITKRFPKGYSLSVSLGKGTRSPNMLERYIKLLPIGYDNYDYLGNPQVKPESNYEADLTVKHLSEKAGTLYLNGFYSYVTNFITATLLPSSVILPQSQGVAGVKQFCNSDHVYLSGFELGYSTPEKFKTGINFTSAFTYGMIPTVTKYILSNNQVTDELKVRNDALHEIPPLEATLRFYHRFLEGKLVPRLSVRVVAAQNHVSEAFYEERTKGFVLVSFSLKYEPVKKAVIHAGVNNILDRAYYEHLNRRIIGTTGKLYEPGRSFYITFIVKI